MKKKVIDTANSRKIKEEALQKMREARENIDPELLEKARQAIATGVQNEQEASQEKDPKTNDVPIDRKKNLQTIMAFLKDLDSNSDFQKRIEKDLKAFIQNHPDQVN